MPGERVSDLLETIRELSGSYWAFSALYAAVETGLLEALAAPGDVASISKRCGLPEGLTLRIVDVLTTLGLIGRRAGRYVAVKRLHTLLRPPAMGLVRADMRTTAWHAQKFIEEAGRGAESTWATALPGLMQSQGLLSAAATEFLATRTFPRVDGLLACLGRPGAVFLDVGAGVCGATIALARHFPRLRIIALEPNPVALGLAKRNLDEAGLTGRVGLRRGRAETLRLRAAVDVAYVAEAFFADASLQRALRRAHTALRPGGYLLTTGSNAEGAGIAAAISRLQRVTLGGGNRSPRDVADRLVRAGYVDVRILDGGSDTVSVVGRRRPSARVSAASRR